MSESRSSSIRVVDERPNHHCGVTLFSTRKRTNCWGRSKPTVAHPTSQILTNCYMTRILRKLSARGPYTRQIHDFGTYSQCYPIYSRLEASRDVISCVADEVIDLCLHQILWLKVTFFFELCAPPTLWWTIELQRMRKGETPYLYLYMYIVAN